MTSRCSEPFYDALGLLRHTNWHSLKEMVAELGFVLQAGPRQQAGTAWSLAAFTAIKGRENQHKTIIKNQLKRHQAVSWPLSASTLCFSSCDCMYGSSALMVGDASE